MSISGSRGCYSQNNGNNSNAGSNFYNESTPKILQPTASDHKTVLKRGTPDTYAQQQSKRQKTTTTTENVTNKHLCSNTVDNSSSISLSQKSIHIESEQISEAILKRTPLNEITTQKTTMVTGSKTNQEWTADKIKSDYREFASCFRYYQNVFQAELGGMLYGMAHMDTNEVQTILGGIQGNAWWIRRNICAYSNQETYAGIVYSNGAFYGMQLLTDDDLVQFFNGKNPALHLEALRKEKLDKIKSDCALFSSLKHYQDVLQEGSRRATTHEITQIDTIEVQTILGGIQGNAWWIRKNIYGVQNAYQGVTYINNKVDYFDLYTDDDLIAFSGLNPNPALHLGALRKEKLDKIKSDCALFSSLKHYQDVLQEGSRGATIHEINQIDTTEVQAVLGGIQGYAWWIRKNIYGVQNAYQGVTYLNNKVNYFDLFTDDDVIQFFKGKTPNLHLEALRKEKLDKIKSDCALFSSLEYYQDVLQKGSRGATIHEINQIDTAEAQAVLGGIQGYAWWIRKNIYGVQNAYQGVTYLNNKVNYFDLFTDDDLIQFFKGKTPNLHLEVIRKERPEKTSKIQKYLAPHSSSTYYKNAYIAESQGLDGKALDLDLAEARVISEDISRTVWWVREGFFNDKKVYKGICYVNGQTFSSSIFYTEDALIQFCERSEPLLHLEKLRKIQYFGPLKDLPKQLYDVLDTQYTLENSIDERLNVLQKIVCSWLLLISPDIIAKQSDSSIKASFKEKTKLYINHETLRLIKEGEVFRILKLFREKNK